MRLRNAAIAAGIIASIFARSVRADDSGNVKPAETQTAQVYPEKFISRKTARKAAASAGRKKMAFLYSEKSDDFTVQEIDINTEILSAFADEGYTDFCLATPRACKKIVKKLADGKIDKETYVAVMKYFSINPYKSPEENRERLKQEAEFILAAKQHGIHLHCLVPLYFEVSAKDADFMTKVWARLAQSWLNYIQNPENKFFKLDEKSRDEAWEKLYNEENNRLSKSDQKKMKRIIDQAENDDSDAADKGFQENLEKIERKITLMLVAKDRKMVMIVHPRYCYRLGKLAKSVDQNIISMVNIYVPSAPSVTSQPAP